MSLAKIGMLAVFAAAGMVPLAHAHVVLKAAGPAPGKYTAVWHAVGDDTPRTEGRYNFEVKK